MRLAREVGQGRGSLPGLSEQQALAAVGEWHRYTGRIWVDTTPRSTGLMAYERVAARSSAVRLHRLSEAGSATLEAYIWRRRVPMALNHTNLSVGAAGGGSGSQGWM